MVTDFNLAAYAHMGVANPVSGAAITAMLDRTDLSPGERAAELGCGNAELAMVMARRGLKVLAVDRGEAMAELARSKVAEAGLTSQVEVRQGEADQIAETEGPFRLVAALGTTQLGDFARLAGWITPGGWLLWGDLFWLEVPKVHPASLGMDYDTDAGWRMRAAEAGLEVVAARISPDEDWDAYIDALKGAAGRWAADNPDHPRRRLIEIRANTLATLYGPASRQTLGFGLYLFRKAADPDPNPSLTTR